MTIPTPTEVRPLEDYRIWVQYSDGVEGIADLSHLAGKGVFALWNDYRQFRSVHIGPSGELAWSDEIDLCPDAIYLKITGMKPEDLFPTLREIAREYA
jgi:hypothetical protein